MKKAFLTLFIVPLLSFTVIHKYYVALTDIKYDEKSKAIQIIMSVDIEDIEDALNDTFKIDAQVSNPNEVKKIDTYFKKYLDTHFKVKINKEFKQFNFLGKEYDGSVVFFYLEIENITNVKSVEVENSVLFSYFPDQQNIIKIKVNGDSKSLILTQENDKGLLKF